MSVNYTEIPVNEEDNEPNQYVLDSKKNKKEAKGNRLLIFSKSKKRILSKIKGKPLSSSSSHPSASSSSGFWKRVRFCGARPPNGLECSSSCNPEPEDENFTLRGLIQTNDFSSRDCNPHL